MDKGPKQEHVARFAWDMLMRMMDILQPKLSTKLPQDNVSEGFHSTFQQYEEFFLHNFNSLSSLIGAIGAGNFTGPYDCQAKEVLFAWARAFLRPRASIESKTPVSIWELIQRVWKKTRTRCFNN